MVKANLKNHRTFLCAVLAVIAAATLRQLGFRAEPPFDWLCPFFRSVIYIVLFTAWGISVRRRIIQSQVRRYLAAISVLMVFWVTARTIRYIIAEDPWVLRHLWYLYYMPMLFIPMLAVFVALSLGKPENYRLPNWTKLIYIPTTVLFLLVLTNDLYQLAFVFPADEAVWANVYDHSIVYYLAVGWMILCALTALGAMLIKCRIPHSHRVLILPFVPVLLAMIYGVLDIVQLPLQKALAGDITVVLCLLFTATLEICIQCSLIQSNTRYGELFRESTLAAQIVDWDYAVQYAAKNTPKIPVEKMREAEAGPAALTEGIQVHNMPVDGGHAVWTEDISQLLRLRESLEDQQDELQERKALLKSEYDQEREHKTIEEQNRLYDLLQTRTQSQLNQIDRLVRTYEKTDGAEEKHQILAHIVVLGSFIKRRKDFVLSIDSAPVISEEKLTSALRESFRALTLLRVDGAFLVQTGKEYLPGELLARAYDFFEDVIETGLDTLRALNVQVRPVGGKLRINILLDCDADFTPLCGKYPQVRIDGEDGETMLVLPLEGGGGA